MVVEFEEEAEESGELKMDLKGVLGGDGKVRGGVGRYREVKKKSKGLELGMEIRMRKGMTLDLLSLEEELMKNGKEIMRTLNN